MKPGKFLLRCFFAAGAFALGVSAFAATNTTVTPTATTVEFAADVPKVLVARADVPRSTSTYYDYNLCYSFTADGDVGYRFEGEDREMFALDEELLNAGTRQVRLAATRNNTENRFRFAWLVITGAEGTDLKKIRVVMAPAPVEDEIEDVFEFSRSYYSSSLYYESGNCSIWDATGVSGYSSSSSSYSYRYIYLTSSSEKLRAARPDVRWIGVTPYSTRAVRYSLSANDGPARTGSIVFESVNNKKITFSVAQAGTQNGIDYDPRNRLPQNGGEFKLSVCADWDLTSDNWPSRQDWTISTRATWVHFLSETSGTGDATLTLSADPNEGKDRTAIISATIGGIPYQVKLTQVGLATKLEFSADSGLKDGDVLYFSPESGSGYEYVQAIESDGEISYEFESGDANFKLDDDAFALTQTLKISTRSDNDNSDGSFRFGVLAIRAGDKVLRLRLVQCHNGNIERTENFGLYYYLNYHVFLGSGSHNYSVSVRSLTTTWPSTETLFGVESQVPWITATTFSGASYFSCIVAKNSGATRVGTVKLTSVNSNVCYHNVTQLGGNGIDTGSIDKIAATGETVYLTVRADWDVTLKDADGVPVWPSGAAWTLSAADSWVMQHVAEEDFFGSGDRRIRFQIDPNPYCEKRTSFVTAIIGDQEYVVTLAQEASEKYVSFPKSADEEPILESSWLDAKKGGDKKEFPLDETSTYPKFSWVCRDGSDNTKAVDWVTPGYDKGSKTVTLSVEKNPYVTPRSAVVYAGDPWSFDFSSAPAANRLLKITVEQEAGDPEIEINKGNPMVYSRSEATRRVVVKSNTDWAVEILEGGEWFSLGSTVSGKANSTGSISLLLQENLTPSERTGKLRFYSTDSTAPLEVEVDVRQLADDPFVRVAEGSAQTFGYKPASGTLTLISNVPWNLSNVSLPEWISLDRTFGNEGETTVTFSLSENEDKVNSRSVTLTFDGGEQSAKVTISQKPTETISSESSAILFPAEGGVRKLTIHANAQWKADGSWPEWLSVSPLFDNAPESGTAEITLTVATANETGTLRAGTLTLLCGEARLEIRIEQQRFYAEPEPEKRGVPEFGKFDYAEEEDYVKDLSAEGEERALDLGFAAAESGIAFTLNPDWLSCELAGTPVKLWIQAIPNAGGLRETWVFVLTDSGDLHALPVRQLGILADEDEE